MSDSGGCGPLGGGRKPKDIWEAGRGRRGLGFFLRGEAVGVLVGVPGTLGARRGEGLGDFILEIVVEGGGMELEPRKPLPLLDNLGLLVECFGLRALRGGECVAGRGTSAWLLPRDESGGCNGSKDIGRRVHS